MMINKASKPTCRQKPLSSMFGVKHPTKSCVFLAIRGEYAYKEPGIGLIPTA
jgi:hypothetical protein